MVTAFLPFGKVTHVRAATVDDLDEVFALVGVLAITFVPRRDAFDAAFRSVLASPDAQLLVVQVGERVGGYLLGFEHPTFFANGPVAWVEEIAVHADLRRRHLASHLMRAFEDGVRGRGGRLVALATTRAGTFYEAIGYDNHASYYRKLLQDRPGG